VGQSSLAKTVTSTPVSRSPMTKALKIYDGEKAAFSTKTVGKTG
jgi:hypothetical protein